MIYTGYIQDGAVVVPEPLPLPNGTPVTVISSADEAQSPEAVVLPPRMQELIDQARAEDPEAPTLAERLPGFLKHALDLPENAALNGDHYKLTPEANGAALPPIINPRTGQPYPSYIPREIAEKLRQWESDEEPAVEGPNLYDRLKPLIEAAGDLNLPPDAALNHDHYLYGHPKKS